MGGRTGNFKVTRLIARFQFRINYPNQNLKRSFNSYSFKLFTLSIQNTSMTKISSSPNCGNSPKMEFLKNFNIAYSKGDLVYLSQCLTDDIVWNIVGHKLMEGKDQFLSEFKNMSEVKTAELKIDQILTHGKEGAVLGVIILENGEQYAFSDFYKFNSAKAEQIKSITSFVIQLSS